MASVVILCVITFFVVATAEGDVDVSTLLERLDKLEAEVSQLRSNCKTSETNDKYHKRVQPSTQVAFSAVLSSHEQDTSGHNKPVKYDLVYTNMGQGYDNTTGVFHPPVNGLYQIYASIAVAGSDSIHAFLEKNGQTLCACTAINYNTGSCMVIVRLQEGDTVWMREVFGVHVRAEKLSTFAGVLLTDN